MKPLHLAKRFFGSLRPGGPSAPDEAWVLTLLSDDEAGLWRRMSGPDQRHAAGVARTVARSTTDRAVLAAALLHDVGKVASGLGTFERVAATLARRWRPRRWHDYYEHPRIGGELLTQAGSAALVVDWARQHHLPPERWTVPAAVGQVLKEADDD